MARILAALWALAMVMLVWSPSSSAAPPNTVLEGIQHQALEQTTYLPSAGAIRWVEPLILLFWTKQIGG